MDEKKLEEIDERIDNGVETDEDIEVLVDFYIDFMETLED